VEVTDDHVTDVSSLGREQVLSQLEELAREVAEDQAAIEGQTDDTRTRVIRMGKRLSKLQKIQKKEQEERKKLGEPVQTWKEWCEQEKVSRGHFPGYEQCRRCVLIARYPKAYEKGMSIKEAYKEAGKWKKNNGNPPIKEKVTIKARPLVTIGAAAGKLNGKIDNFLNENIEALAADQQWTEDEILGATDEITLLRQGCNALLKILKQLHAST